MLPLSSDALRQRLRSFASRAQPLRILLTLGSLMAVCSYTGHTDAVIPLFLGAIASALAETDDSWRGRFRAQLVTLACFAVLSFSVEADPLPSSWADDRAETVFRIIEEALRNIERHAQASAVSITPSAPV